MFFEKLRFRDGLVCTVGLAVEIKLHFQINFFCVVWMGPQSCYSLCTSVADHDVLKGGGEGGGGRRRVFISFLVYK